MGSKVWLVFLLLALAMVAESTTFHEASWGLTHFGNDELSSCIDGQCDVEDLTETLMDSEINRRQLAQKRYISYGALKANSVPCNRRGNSYYNCQNKKRANPYNRGCSAITHCYRYTS
ncbi:protein RALF-like 19 [Herrania umbratica]|uniref:Protein RALF-like 19 n=1 Tax=Herrania umbratica TaxID=108875 RepID=A0A6J1B6L7_9ROSI|nr:protein RALF-like 19 [Herrania umbratica]